MKKIHKLAFILFASIFAGIVFAYLLLDISQKKQEAKNPFFVAHEIGELEEDPAVWGKAFPHQYDTYKKTVDQTRTRYGGSEAISKNPTPDDPRSVVSQSRLEEDKQLVKMWDGYAFSVDFREERGHAYMLEDQLYTKRQEAAKQPGTCINCHASTYTAYMKLGEGDITKGFHALNKMPYKEAATHVKHPVSCLDCHDPKTMDLRVTRPAFIEGMKQWKASEGIANYDVNKKATRQEMRSFVCGQCHVEYYFKGPEKTLTYPWSKGIKADEILAYYRENPHVDWKHAKAKSPMLKAQHPEFEFWNQGIHAKAGVSCTDCHMPYQRIGAMKVTNHHVQSPLLNLNKACQTCHHTSEAELKERVLTIQSRHQEMRNKAMNALMELIDQLEKANKDQVIAADKIAKAQNYHREAQFLIDFVEAENSSGFHAPQEAGRILVQAMDFIRKAQLELQ